MEELLRKWAEIEPNRCQFVFDGEQIEVLMSDGEWCWVWAKREYGGAFVPSTTTAYMHIQAAVQAAIEARGWGMNVGHGYEVAEWTASVWHRDTPHGILDTHVARKDNAAEALLEAYVKAIVAIT